MAGLLDALKQYIADAAPGGLLNQEQPKMLADLLQYGKTKANYIGGLLDPQSPINNDFQNWHKRTQLGLADQLAGRETPSAEQAYQTMMGMAGLAPVGMMKPARTIADEIGELRQLVQPRAHTLPNGEVVKLIPRYSPNEGAITGLVHDTPSVRRSYPSGNFSPNDPMMANLTPQQRMAFTLELREVNNQKRTLAQLVDAKQYLSQPTTPSPAPEWAKKLSAPQNTAPASASWWNQALKAPAVDAFADSIRGNQSAFVLPANSPSKKIGEIADLFSTRSKNPIFHEWNGDDLVLKSGKGSLSIVDAASETPFIRSISANSQGNKDGAGKELYQAAYNWTGNNGKMVAADPGGLSEINEIRKTGNVLAAQVRNGGRPVAEMNTGDLSGPRGVYELWKSEAKQAAKRLPGISVKFDGKTFSKADHEIEGMIKAVDPTFSKGVGLMTAKRKAIFDWLAKATPKQAREAAENWKSGAIFPAALLIPTQDDESRL